MKKLLQKLNLTASKLDSLQETKLANDVDKVLTSLAIDEWQDPSYVELPLDIEEEMLQEDKQKELLDLQNKDEEMETLTKNFFTDSKGSEKYLEERLIGMGIVPLKVQGSAFLGAGVQGSVLRGLWNGKQVAVKITSEDEEAENTKTLMNVRDSLSDTAKKHTPEIYDIKKDEQGFHYIIMELLSPAPEFMLRHLFDVEDEDEKKIFLSPIMPIGNLLKDESKVYAALIDAAGQANVPRRFSSEVFKKFLSLKIPDVIQKPEDWKRVVLHINDKIFEYISEVEKELNKTFKNSVMFAEAFLENLIFMVKPSFPESPEFLTIDEYIIEQVPELNSFIQALQELGKEGLYWGDLHYENIMQRPSTGELVFVDLGYFTPEIEYDWDF